MGEIRIISGRLKGRKITVAKSRGTPVIRPSTDRARTTLFNWLMHLGAIDKNTYCADLFCGSGILGIEALSRGAVFAAYVDDSIQVLRQLENNLAKLGINNQEHLIYHDTVDTFCSSSSQMARYNLVFCDPPYAITNYQELLKKINPLLARNGYLYIESGGSLSIDTDDQWCEIRTRRLGNSWLYLLRKP